MSPPQQMPKTAFVAAAFLLCACAVGRPAETWTQPELRAFARQLGEHAAAHHIKRDPKSPQAGMVYKWYRPRDGRWVIDPARNMLSDAAWFAYALALHHRTTGEAWSLDLLRRHPLPFFKKVLTESDALFGVGKGICPFWWDDGAAVALATGRSVTGFPARPRLTSNALALDLATMLMSADMLVGDTGVTLAAAYLMHGDRACYGDPAVPLLLGVAAGTLGQDETLVARCLPMLPWLNEEGPAGDVFEALCQGREKDPAGAVEEALRLYQAHVTAQPWQPVNDAVAGNFVRAVYSTLRLADLWYDDTPRPPGVSPFDHEMLRLGERFFFYHSNQPDAPIGTRHGPMLLCGAALALQLLDAFPNAWEAWARQKHPGDFRVSEKLAPLSAPGASGPVELAWSASSLLVRARGPLKLDFAAVHPATGSGATLVIDDGGRVAVTGEKGAELLVMSARQADGSVNVEVPFTIERRQKRWLNAVENARWTVRINGAPPRGLLLLSTPESVRARLAVELSDGLRFWQQMFREWGHLPAAFSFGKKQDARAGLSDVAGCGFLIAAASEYACWLRGERDWTLALKTRAKPQPAP
ncbi:MAG: hypothetical protein N2689_01765 [Verrucomicrobiae bacterium]|nr:hypothetical protein [Verrucomicrobiae bacterium]